ncbi:MULTISPECIES: D-hexose-6-phosphate mutarotase [Pseudomonas syringae group]|jgi:glucose-6-phosphate 1-epimerase|uniref:Putative glucose-6-phosphate 1-epimerase n=6 Tax=Pseudomonas syringae group TaxID=136849 RepID=A0A656JNT5_PSESF|nr:MULTISPECIES: D-hexose-6-phosphate mutarotase [Pseudomonas syringae group]EPN41253.1 aldose 1-epimerase [Pseudomonas syringae pv. actinidiae ICMP 19096]EPM50701.1 aldose 1-epimerase [Pseudomonas syringae pv. actinidiae ICMP 19098]EPN20826.1 aldose 1-epimerase [Pseudomonas syringae pv. actinidiae ICMP 19100]EPN28508.1 aldose 1-epimerase [Pseudomonas syringae pv. actinidiae ICMP 19099]EPN36676.1 aldose 1-epimerase [Pseudomonas syringae pv. actinidiae ICMP 18883]
MPTSPVEPLVESVQYDELNCWRIRHGEAELLVAQQGAHILSYQVAGQPPLVWLNEEAAFKKGKAIRAGMPICWPWFGNLERNPQSVQAMRDSSEPAKAHGEVRALDWQLLGIGADGDALLVEFVLPEAEGHLPGWPHNVALKLSIRLDHALNVSLVSYNCGAEPVTFSQALHTYFAVSDVRQVSVEGLDGLRYIETLANWEEREQTGDLTFTGETDRIYQDTPGVLSIVDPEWQRRIHIRSTGSKSAILWNPWIEKTGKFTDMAADGWQRMVCVETANVLDDVVTLAPDQMHVLGVSIWGEAL